MKSAPPPKRESQAVKKIRSYSSVTVEDVISGFLNDFHRLMTTSRIAAMIVPAFLIISGVYIIYKQVWPTFQQTVAEQMGFFEDNSTSLVAGEYVSLDTRFSNPGARYFSELKNYAQEQNLLFTDEKSANYQGTFQVSIPSLELYDIKVTANVDSGVEEVYDALLTDGLAHFEGTSLPHTDNDTSNVVIYGHSSAGDYYERTKDPAAAFSRLSKIKYGSEIIVKFEGQEYKYKFIKGKIVDANDLSVLQGKRGQHQLTLFTCYPNGSNGKRFVAEAKLIS